MLNENKTINLKDKFGLTIDEAVYYSGIGENTLRLLIKNKKIPVLLIGRKHIIRKDTLEKFIIENQSVNLLNIQSVKSVS